MYTRKIRATGETLTVARPEEVNADPEGGKWVTLCEDHKTMAYSATEKLAYYTHGIDFCDGCREGSPAPTPKAEPAKAKATTAKPAR
jgi:hypothetical protein